MDISGAGIKRAVVINQKRLKTKKLQSTVIKILLTLMLPSAVVVSGTENSTIVRNDRR